MDEDSVPEKNKKQRIKPSKYESSILSNNKKYWDKVLGDVNFYNSSKQNESIQLSKILPKDLYEKVCNTLDIPVMPRHGEETKGNPERIPRRLVKEPLLSYRKTLIIDREMDSDTDVEYSPSDEEDIPNIHRELLRKPVREQVTWETHYLQPEREDEKSLVKKADDLTDRIAQDFCEYMKQLGGKQQSQLFTPKAIKELFQIEFDTHVARSLKVVAKELPTVGDKVAKATGHPEHSNLAALEREVLKDIKAEHSPDVMVGFGKSIPGKEQWRAPHNDTKTLWQSARRVPKDLVTLKTVWEGITNLRSVKEYCRWMIEHPEHRRAPYLSSLGMFDPAVLDARLSYGQKDNALSPPSLATRLDDPPAPIEQIRKRLSELTEII